MTQLPLFNLPAELIGEPSNAPRVAADRANRPYGKGRPCTPYPPGSGPQGETCGGCVFLERVKHHEYHYLKCGLMKHAWTHGGGTDIKAKWPACLDWCPKELLKNVGLVRSRNVDVGGGVGLLTARVYRRMREAEKLPQDDWPAPRGLLASAGELWAWWDFHQESYWRPLLPPGYAVGERWEVVRD